jgi:hypothetical protein
MRTWPSETVGLKLECSCPEIFSKMHINSSRKIMGRRWDFAEIERLLNLKCKVYMIEACPHIPLTQFLVDQPMTILQLGRFICKL